MIPRDPPHFLQVRLAVRRHLSAHIPGGGRLIVGVSGGPDSLALAFALYAEGADAFAVSVDHGLQPGSAEVSRRALAQLPIPGEVLTLTGVTNEADAREKRYAALLGFGAPVAVAHTAEDQAETLLLGALRGIPTGMPPVTERLVHRPLLGARRADTVGACRELGLSVWEDPHNSQQRFRRVAVRTRVIPLLAEIAGGGDVVAALAATAGRIAEDDAALAAQARPVTADCAALAALPAAVRRRAILAWLHEAGVGPTGASISAIEALCVNWHGQGPVAVGGGAQVIRRAGRLELAR